MPYPFQRKFDWEEAARFYVAAPDITLRELARRFGVTEMNVARALKRFGVKRGTDAPGKYGIVPRDEFAELYARFPSNGALAQHLGVEPCSVWQRAKRMGLPPRRIAP
jgi:transcriptional regulator of aromatic amino acid metabolism